MKAKDVTKPSDKKLMEQIQANPVTGFKQEDMFELAQAVRDDNFDAGMTLEEMMRDMQKRGLRE